MTHNVVVIGAGYAGLPAARRLARQVHKDEVTVTLVSAFPTFVERPRLHQLSVGQPIKQMPVADFLRGTAVQLVVASVTDIDLEAQQLVTVDEHGRRRTMAYQTLIYALGSNIDVTSVPGVAEHCFTLMGTSSAMDLRGRLIDLAAKGGTVAVCGGGLTGIETACEVAETFPDLDVQLISRSAPGSWLSTKARSYLDEAFTNLKVSIVEGADVDHVESGAFVLADGRHLPFDLSIWSGGFSVPTLARTVGLAVNSTDRALVDPTLRSISHPNVYVIGDAAAVAGSWGDEVAMGCRSGGFTGPKVADVVAARLAGREPSNFKFRYFHECISLGRKHGLIQFLNADESPKSRILIGRKAILYKNVTLNGAKVLFRHSGPVMARRRHVKQAETPSVAPSETVDRASTS